MRARELQAPEMGPVEWRQQQQQLLVTAPAHGFPQNLVIHAPMPYTSAYRMYPQTL